MFETNIDAFLNSFEAVVDVRGEAVEEGHRGSSEKEANAAGLQAGGRR
jgi:hypothetical protein